MKLLITAFAIFILSFQQTFTADWDWELVRENVVARSMTSTINNDYVFYAVGPYGGGEKTFNGTSYENVLVPAWTIRMYFTDANTGYAYTGDGGTVYSWRYILQTTNGGASWNNVADHIGTTVYYPLQFIKTNGSFYLAGLTYPYVEDKGLIKSVNGVDWQYDSPGWNITGIAEGLDGIYASSWHQDSTRFMVKKYNSSNWEKIFSFPADASYSPFQNISSQIAQNNERLIFMGAGNIIARYNEHDQSLLTQTIEDKIGTVRFKNSNTGYIACNNPGCILYQTIDGGDNWLKIAQFTESYQDFSILNNGVLLYLSNSNLYYSAGGLTQINTNTNQAVNFSLSQNYPNPFNPSTTIQYQIPKQSHVSIKVFDMSGKEIATLVDEVKSSGIYKQNFNASSFSSGVYFYTLNTGDFTETRKMILVK